MWNDEFDKAGQQGITREGIRGRQMAQGYNHTGAAAHLKVPGAGLPPKLLTDNGRLLHNGGQGLCAGR